MAKTGRQKKLKIVTPVSLIRNISVAAVCVLGICGSLIFYRNDLNSTIQKLEEKPIGTVHRTQNTGQRLSSGHVQWERLEKFSPVYNGDLINTAPFSEVFIGFNNGETLELSENSAVQISLNENGNPGIELLKGAIHVQSGRENLAITPAANNENRNTRKIELGSRTSASISSPDNLAVKIFQGSGILFLDNDSHSIYSGQAFNALNNIPEEMPALMLTPRDGARILKTSDIPEPVRFQWRHSMGSEAAFLLEFSQNRNFSLITKALNIENKDYAEVDLAEGTWYWRLFLNETEADSGRLEILNNSGPRALSPANGSTETLYAGNSGLQFFWIVPEEAEAVLLEVADNPEMSRPRIRQLVKKTGGGYGSHISAEIGAGQWYWRVHPVFSGGISEGDNILSRISGNHGYWRVRPVNSDIMADDRPSPVNSFKVVSSTEPQAVKTAAGFTNAIPGYSPQVVFPPDSYVLEANRTPDIIFSWRNPLLYRARFQIAERSDFAGTLIVDEWVSGSSIRGIHLDPGAYYWRVTGTGPAGSGESRPVRLVVERSLAMPKLGVPLEDAVLRMADNRTVTFSWQKENYADYYSYRLFLAGRTSPLTEISFLENTSLQVSFDPNTSGDFYWTVQGFTSATESRSVRGGLMAQNTFSVVPRTVIVSSGIVWSIPRIENIEFKQGEVQAPITLVSPVTGTTISGITALRSPPIARWNINEPIQNAQLIISSTTNPSADPRAIVLDAGAGTTARFPQLPEGTWYWIIRGDTIDRRGATPGEIFWIKVLPIPQLPAPVIIQPEQDSVIGIEQLTRDRQIIFRWEEVEGADAYVFSLYREAAPPVRLVNTDPDPRLGFIFDDLLRLNEGDYYWQVEAVSKNDRGQIEQRGITETHNFKIEIQRSEGFQTQTQGTLYGQ